jgi:hypothetical protein
MSDLSNNENPKKKKKLIGNGTMAFIGLALVLIILFGVSKILKSIFMFALIALGIVILGWWVLRKFKSAK